MSKCLALPRLIFFSKVYLSRNFDSTFYLQADESELGKSVLIY